jgi:hypothetical protein
MDKRTNIRRNNNLTFKALRARHMNAAMWARLAAKQCIKALADNWWPYTSNYSILTVSRLQGRGSKWNVLHGVHTFQPLNTLHFCCTGCFKRQLHNCIPNVTVFWNILYNRSITWSACFKRQLHNCIPNVFSVTLLLYRVFQKTASQLYSKCVQRYTSVVQGVSKDSFTIAFQMLLSFETACTTEV